MTQQEYEQKKRECFVQFCKDNGIDQEVNISIFDAFDQIFDRAYALGKQEKDAEGEDETLYVSRKKIQYFFEKLRTVGENYVAFALQSLFGSKCLTDEGIDCTLVEVGVAENATTTQKPAEPKFKVGDKVKDISSPHDDGIYRVNDIKKSSDGFIYHIQGLIGKSNVKESALEPYTEPKTESRNFSQNIANCDKHFDSIIKDGFRNERRLNIATQICTALIGNQDLADRIISADEDLRSFANDAYIIADALIAEAEKKGDAK